MQRMFYREIVPGFYLIWTIRILCFSCYVRNSILTEINIFSPFPIISTSLASCKYYFTSSAWVKNIVPYFTRLIGESNAIAWSMKIIRGFSLRYYDMGLRVSAWTPQYQKFNAQILTLGVFTGFSLWPHTRGNHLVDHGIPCARLVWYTPITGPVISTNDAIVTFEKSFKRNSIHRQTAWTIYNNWITNSSIQLPGGWGNFRASISRNSVSSVLSKTFTTLLELWAKYKEFAILYLFFCLCSYLSYVQFSCLTSSTIDSMEWRIILLLSYSDLRHGPTARYQSYLFIDLAF